MYMLKPSNERLRTNAGGTVRRVCTRLYQSILKCLLKSYKYYAISDTISIDCGKIKIVHEFRDLEFEAELLRNNIDVHAHVVSRDLPVSISKGRHGFCFKYFKWKELKSIYIGDKELFIKHGHSLSIDGNVSAGGKSSIVEDMIIRSIIELGTIPKEQQPQTACENMEIDTLRKHKNPRPPKNGLFKGEDVRGRGGQESTPLDNEPRIAKRGFEIDTTF